MKTVISKDGAIKVFYYLMAIDGDVTAELEKFDEIGREFMKEDFDQNRQAIIDECQVQIDSATDDELYDVVLEGVDRALAETADSNEDGVCPRLLIWDMLTIAYTDNEYANMEKRLIAHVVRVLGVDKDVFMEMEHLINTADAVVKELDTLNSSNRPYSEIRPIVDEIEKRKITITKAVEDLIADDYIIDTPKEDEKAEGKDSKITQTGKKISESLSPVKEHVGEFAKKTISGAKDLVEKMPDKKEISEGAGKFFSKVKDFGKKEEK